MVNEYNHASNNWVPLVLIHHARGHIRGIHNVEIERSAEVIEGSVARSHIQNPSHAWGTQYIILRLKGINKS